MSDKTTVKAVVSYYNAAGKLLKTTTTTHEATDLQAKVTITIEEAPPNVGGNTITPTTTPA